MDPVATGFRFCNERLLVVLVSRVPTDCKPHSVSTDPRHTHVEPDYVKLCTPLFSLFQQTVRRESWLTKKNVRTHRALARRSPTENIVALRAKEPARLSSWIATADTMCVREISEAILARKKGTKGVKMARA